MISCEAPRCYQHRGASDHLNLIAGCSMAKAAKTRSPAVRNILDRAPFLRQQHADFLAIYKYCEDAGKAARLAGLELKEAKRGVAAYVYYLLDPDRARVLYVGKGCGARMHHHVRDVRNGVISGTKKHVHLDQLLRAGKQPVPVIFCEGLTDNDALSLEGALIEWIGTVNLLNSNPGEVGPHDRGSSEFVALLKQIKPFNVWFAESPRSAADVELYRKVVREIRRVAAEMDAGIYADTIKFRTDSHGIPQVELSYKRSKTALGTPEEVRRYQRLRAKADRKADEV